ncbi:MAG: PAS domain-containing protein, partial [Thermacetogeniaceae bacterium]
MEASGVKEIIPKGGKKDYAFLDLIQDSAFVVDTDKKVIYANEAFTTLVAKKRGQAIGAPIGFLIKAEESGVDSALATGDKAHILTWAVIKDKKYFLEFEPIPLLDEKGNIIGVFETVRDLTGQKLALQAVQELVVKAKAGDLSARVHVKVEGDYQLLVDGFNEMLDTVVEPIDELMDVLKRIAGNDLTRKVDKEYSGVWNELKNATNNVQGQLVGIREVVINISNGDLSDLDNYKKIGKRSDKDTLMPAFIKLIESIKSVIDEIVELTGSVS